ncbi:hypothetical protein O6H91_06G084200 [Diphasiastrum complanatum]|uniref:Uncharacterized protein n=8 Tax=Diphasiastrum complanatum TaxID=34168 RepID=A0ACC2DFQ8_DIPCM|nr:hypothetical protein O6H91_06G084200 [Diphasiastrum complanatum]KAJ7553091.1 hypothetical protein O6H91_06G084200 [Diphasiastrum complanatum]KAJ7553092.1 hypothetical protein O6H91_06G084200 [Diphasiastrum complanatum]KAJ7553093.1 hypothetical protein O6H91_06G084200 [Diphasiastrum complanatum]KAJ7553096.1 hypothetical protein O6H91_06G084200 [Diphasiastrum complanatum]
MAVAAPEVMALSPNLSYSELLVDICKFRKLSSNEKRELLFAFEKGSCQGRDILQSWSRRQLKQYLNLQMGAEKKFTCYSKCRLIDRIVKVLLMKDMKNDSARPQQSLQNNALKVVRRLRKAKHPTRLPELVPIMSSPKEGAPEVLATCSNAACRAKLNANDTFCKRCSCCICWQFDDNKDPSLWIVCELDMNASRGGCGLSCHLQCALNLQLAGVKKLGKHEQLDGSYRCLSCGTITGLLGCWKKQLIIAKEARRMDVLCHRIILACQILKGTMKYQELHDNVERAAQKLEQEIGPVGEGSNKLARGIVSRLSTAADIQKCIEDALMKMNSVSLEPETQQGSESPDENIRDSFSISFIDASSASITVVLNTKNGLSQNETIGHELWHRKASEINFGSHPTYSLSYDRNQFTVSDLEAETEYLFRLVLFLKRECVGNLEASYSTKGLESESNHFRSKEATTKRNNHSISSLKLEELTTNETQGVNSLCTVRDLEKLVSPPIEVNSSDDENLDNVQSKLGKFENPTRSITDKVGQLVGSDSTVVRFKQVIRKQKKSSFLGLHKVPCKRSLDRKGCKLALKVLFKRRPRRTESPLQKLGNQPQDRKAMNISQGRMIVDKHPLTNETNSFDAFQTPKNSVSDVVPIVCSVPDTATDFNLGSEKNQLGPYWHNKVQMNGHTFRVIVHPDADGQSTTLDLMEKPRVRTAFDQSLENLGRACEQELSPCQNMYEENFEYWVTVVRWLENQGHVGSHFRMRFLSWLGVRATTHEKKVVDTYMKIMIADPTSLAEQLVDTYEEINPSVRRKIALHVS